MTESVHHWNHNIEWSQVLLIVVLLATIIEFGGPLAQSLSESEGDSRDTAQTVAGMMN